MPTAAPTPAEPESETGIRVRWRARLLDGRTWGSWGTNRVTWEQFWNLIAAMAKGQAQVLLVEG